MSQRLVRSIVVSLALALALVAPAHAAVFSVDSPVDAVDAGVGDGVCKTAAGGCTLRAAIQEADAAGGASIVVVPSGRYRLTIAPVPEAGSAAETDAATGDLDLSADVTLRGDGAGRTILDGGGVDRVLETGTGVRALVQDLTITGGDSTAGGSQEIDLGGGILNKSGITLLRVELVGNLADGGGGMFSIPGTLPVIRDSLIHDNEAYEGGGLRIDSGATIVNTTITHNRLRSFDPSRLPEKPVGIVVPAINEIAGYGGGIDNRGGDRLLIANSTITDNHAVKGGGGIGAGQGYAPLSGDVPLGGVSLRNTIVAGNTSDAGPRDCRTNAVVFTSLGHNLDGDGSCFLTGPGDRPGQDPRVGPLAGNGGPMATLALLAGSPAIDGGGAEGCPAADARGVARPQGAACDIGAFEYVVSVPEPAGAPAAVPEPKRRVITAFYGRRARLHGAVLVRVRSVGGPVSGIRVELRRPGGALIARSAALRARVVAREVALRRARGRRFAAGRYTLVVRRGGQVVARRSVRLRARRTARAG